MFCFTVGWILPVSISIHAQNIAATPPLTIGNTKQLFVDDHIIDTRKSVEFVMNRPHPTGEKLIIADQPFEKGGQIYLYSSVLKDQDGKVKIWYDFLRQKSETDPYDHDRHVGYAESLDGIHFHKPNVRIYQVEGSQNNNVVLPSIIGGTSVWIDPIAPKEHRYKTQAKVYPSGKFHMHSSPDGIHWNLYSEIDPRGAYDTQTIIFWDQNQHLSYSRYFIEKKENDSRIYRRRGVRRSILKDYKFLEDTDVVLWPDMTDLQTHTENSQFNPVDYYGATVFPYSETQGLYIMLAQAFWHWDATTEYQGTPPPGTRDIRLAISRDGINFKRVGERKAFISPGLLGRFDSKQIWVMPNPIIMGDEIWFYYCGINWDRAGRTDPMAPQGEKQSAITRAVLRLDGFISMDAPYDQWGEIVTQPLIFEGNNLEINIDTGGGGSLRVEILEEDGTPIPGFTLEEAEWIVGNSVRYPARWRNNTPLRNLEGKPIRLRFVFRDAKLYAFQFK